MRLSAHKKYKMMTYFTLSPSWQSIKEASCKSRFLDDIKSTLVINLEKFLTATLMKVKQQWPREIGRMLTFVYNK